MKWLICLAVCLSLTRSEARKLAQAPAPSASAGSGYTATLLTALSQNASESVTRSQVVPFGSGSSLLVAWDSGNASLSLAFATSNADNASLTQQVSDLAPVEYLSGFFGGEPPTASPNAVQLFNTSIGNATAANGAVSSVTQGANSTSIGRVLCTGLGGGGALAQLCGPWAQINYPNAQVRVISFGSPRVGDDKFNWALQQLVDLPYLWLTASDNVTVGQTPSGPVLLPNITRVIPEGNATAEGPAGSIQYYTTLLNNTLKVAASSSVSTQVFVTDQANGSAIPITFQTNFSYGYLPGGRESQFVASAAPEGGGFLSRVSSAVGTATDTISAAGSAISNAVGNIFSPSSSAPPAPAPSTNDFAGLAPSSSSGSPLNTGGAVSSSSAVTSSEQCTPILCKLKPAISQACAAYGNGATLGQGSVTVSAENTSTNVAVAWDDTLKVATFAWRGTQESEDWIQNLKLQFSDDTSSEYFTELYAGTRVYEGELNQFRAVTDQAAGAEQNIRTQLEMMSQGQTPARVDCIGHSLGAGLSTICGPWAAEEWPTADIRVVNFGSPKAGNMQFAESVFATVGRAYRVVHQQDAVPSLPPFNSYIHAEYALWINQSTIYLDERPPMEIDDLTWDDHGCDDQYKPAIDAATNVTLPSWVMSLA